MRSSRGATLLRPMHFGQPTSMPDEERRPSSAKASFTVYIDESGDEGFVFQPNERGSSRWLVLSAVVLRKRNDLEAVRLMREVRQRLGKDSKKALHFRELRHEQRVPYA